MGEERAREHCMLAGRLEEIGCVAVGGRGRGSQQCQGKPDELPTAKLGERSIRSMRRSRRVGTTRGRRTLGSLRHHVMNKNTDVFEKHTVSFRGVANRRI